MRWLSPARGLHDLPGTHLKHQASLVHGSCGAVIARGCLRRAGEAGHLPQRQGQPGARTPGLLPCLSCQLALPTPAECELQARRPEPWMGQKGQQHSDLSAAGAGVSTGLSGCRHLLLEEAWKLFPCSHSTSLRGRTEMFLGAVSRANMVPPSSLNTPS